MEISKHIIGLWRFASQDNPQLQHIAVYRSGVAVATDGKTLACVAHSHSFREDLLICSESARRAEKDRLGVDKPTIYPMDLSWPDLHKLPEYQAIESAVLSADASDLRRLNPVTGIAVDPVIWIPWSAYLKRYSDPIHETNPLQLYPPADRYSPIRLFSRSDPRQATHPNQRKKQQLSVHYSRPHDGLVLGGLIMPCAWDGK